MSVVAAVLEDARRDGRALWGGALGIALGLASVVFFGGLGVGVKEGVLKRALTRLPVGTVEVRPKGGVPVGFLKFEGSDLIMRPLDDAALEELRAQPGVSKVYPRAAALFPMRAQGGKSLLGRDVYTDIFASGVDAEFLKEDLAPGTPFEDVPSGAIPCVISSQLLELFNRAVAPALGIPGMTEETVLGFAFTVVLGESFSSGRTTGGEKVPVQVVGVSEKAMLLGITVPRATVERWGQRWAPKEQRGHAGAYVVTNDGAALSDVAKKVEAMGYVVEQSSRVAGAMVTALMLTWLVVAALILVVAGFNVAQTLAARVQARRKEIGLMRAVGARPSHIRNLVLGEALLMAVVASLLGLGMGVTGGYATDALVRRYLPRFPFQPDSFFQFPWWLVLGALGCAFLCAVVGALPPARAASRVDPARALE
jgi:putative ABC transport system permease protein